jgi:hypothetical protein
MAGCTGKPATDGMVAAIVADAVRRLIRNS